MSTRTESQDMNTLAIAFVVILAVAITVTVINLMTPSGPKTAEEMQQLKEGKYVDSGIPTGLQFFLGFLVTVSVIIIVVQLMQMVGGQKSVKTIDEFLQGQMRARQ